jgi:hypothetical protein
MTKTSKNHSIMLILLLAFMPVAVFAQYNQYPVGSYDGGQSYSDMITGKTPKPVRYSHNNKVRENYNLVFDTTHLEYSAANLFQGLIADVDYRMYVEQSIYGMKTINYTLSFQQWLNYCAQLGMKIFFAVEEQREDGILAIVIAQSRELGFNHLLSVVIPDKFVTDKNAVMKVRLSPYIPTHNVKDLYQKESANHKKNIWK